MTQNEHQSLIKTPRQLIAVGVLAVIVPVFGAVMLASFVVTSSKYGGAQSSMAPEEVARRIKPVAEVVIGEAAPAAAAGIKSGEEVYKGACMACHGAGVAGAPKLGDKAGWAARIAGGQKKLVSSGMKGVRGMPPRGGAADLSDTEFERAVVYMANAAGASFKDPVPAKSEAAKATK